MTTNPTAVPEAAVEAAAKAMHVLLDLNDRWDEMDEDERESYREMVRPSLSATLPLLSVPEAPECGVEHPEQTLLRCALDRGHDGQHVSPAGWNGASWPSDLYVACGERDEAVAQVERVRALAGEPVWITRDRSLVQRGYVLVDDINTALAARTPDDDAEGKS